MKEHKIDQLFRQKLQQHSMAPTPAAWEKVATGLNHRRRKRGGYYAAAAVMLLLLSAGWFWLQQNGAADQGQQAAVAVTEQTAPGQKPDADREVTAIQESASVAINANETPAAIEVPATANDRAEARPAAKRGNTSKKPGSQPAAANQVQLADVRVETALPAEQGAANTAAPADLVTETALAQALPEAPASQPADMELQPDLRAVPAAELVLAKAEQVIIRYEGSDAATTEDKPDSAPEKVLSLLQKVKHGDIGLADIRNAKDNIFSGRFNKP